MAWRSRAEWEAHRFDREYQKAVAEAARNTGRPIAFHDRYTSDFAQAYGRAFFSRGKSADPMRSEDSREALYKVMYDRGRLAEPTEEAFEDEYGDIDEVGETP